LLFPSQGNRVAGDVNGGLKLEEAWAGFQARFLPDPSRRHPGDPKSMSPFQFTDYLYAKLCCLNNHASLDCASHLSAIANPAHPQTHTQHRLFHCIDASRAQDRSRRLEALGRCSDKDISWCRRIATTLGQMACEQRAID
jgi:hypothetical protein